MLTGVPFYMQECNNGTLIYSAMCKAACRSPDNSQYGLYN